MLRVGQIIKLFESGKHVLYFTVAKVDVFIDISHPIFRQQHIFFQHDRWQLKDHPEIYVEPISSIFLNQYLISGIFNNFTDSELSKICDSSTEEPVSISNNPDIWYTRFSPKVLTPIPSRTLADSYFIGMSQQIKPPIAYICELGNIRLFEYYRSQGTRLLRKYTEYAAENGQLEFIKYLHVAHGLVPTPNSANLAPGSGNIQLVRYLRDTFKLLPNSLESAIRNSRFEMLDVLETEFNIRHNINSREYAVESGNTKMYDHILNRTAEVDLLHQHVRTSKYHLCHSAIRSGNLDMIKRFLSDSEITHDHARSAAMYGQLDVLKYFMSKAHIQLQSEELDSIIMNDHVEIYRYLRTEMKMAPTDDSFEFAVSFSEEIANDLLKEFNCEVDQERLDESFGNCSIEFCKKLLTVSGLTPSEKAMDEAIRNCNVPAVKYLHENYNFAPETHINVDVRGPYIYDLLDFLFEKFGWTPPDNSLIHSAIAFGNIDLEEYLKEKFGLIPDSLLSNLPNRDDIYFGEDIE